MTTLKNSKADVLNPRLDMVDQPFRFGRVADATERDAKIPNPQDGDAIYLESTDKLQLRAAGAWIDLG